MVLFLGNLNAFFHIYGQGKAQQRFCRTICISKGLASFSLRITKSSCVLPKEYYIGACLGVLFVNWFTRLPKEIKILELITSIGQIQENLVDSARKQYQELGVVVVKMQEVLTELKSLRLRVSELETALERERDLGMTR